MRKEERAQRLTHVFYGLLLHRVFQPIRAFFASLFDNGAPGASNAFCPEEIRRRSSLGRHLLAAHHWQELQQERALRRYHHLIDNQRGQFKPRSYVGGHHHVAQ